MIQKDKLFNVLNSFHISEKSSSLMKENTFSMKVSKNSNKIEIKRAIINFFSVKVKSVNTLVIRKKNRKHVNKKLFRKRTYKKAYITLEKNQNLDFIEKIQ
ncbi:hypothetical protein AOQ88_01675 [Candidatus Riesia sp. GBBU]|nr:hypothetical protein AOQ88_01675 [Candidatus Riesia sp. GBBU]